MKNNLRWYKLIDIRLCRGSKHFVQGLLVLNSGTDTGKLNLPQGLTNRGNANFTLQVQDLVELI
ncbi:hypothetical protein IPH70_00575 [Candidatus Roizmanbacteria bacterium]|nr:MAG: hypothetical protein IPH70_00575 [Candidatus Roizmanbacteria bacterium]